MTTTQVSCHRPQTSGCRRAWHYIGLGSLCGLAWLAWPARLHGAGRRQRVGGRVSRHLRRILAPGVATGAMLGLAEWLRRTGGTTVLALDRRQPLGVRRGVPQRPAAPRRFLASGIGGGAIGVPLMAMACGYAMSGRGPRRSRALLGLVSLSSIPLGADGHQRRRRRPGSEPAARGVGRGVLLSYLAVVGAQDGGLHGELIAC